MVTGRSPFFDQIRGAFQICDVRTRKNRKIEIAKYRIPSNPRTQAQQAVRTKYGQAVAGWRSLSAEQKAQYNELAKPLGWSGWNYYLWLQYQVTTHELTINVSEDTFSYYGSPNANYNGLGLLQINNYPGTLERIFVKFNLSQIPSNAQIQEAKLYLYWYQYINNNPAGLQLDANHITANWSETTLTWNNSPTYEATPIASANFPSSYGWIIFDVASDLQAILSGQKTNYGWMIKYHYENASSPGATANIRNKESGTNIPYLYVKAIW
jgi:hypothetical protein